MGSSTVNFRFTPLKMKDINRSVKSVNIAFIVVFIHRSFDLTTRIGSFMNPFEWMYIHSNHNSCSLELNFWSIDTIRLSFESVIHRQANNTDRYRLRRVCNTQPTVAFGFSGKRSLFVDALERTRYDGLYSSSLRVEPDRFLFFVPRVPCARSLAVIVYVYLGGLRVDRTKAAWCSSAVLTIWRVVHLLWCIRQKLSIECMMFFKRKWTTVTQMKMLVNINRVNVG